MIGSNWGRLGTPGNDLVVTLVVVTAEPLRSCSSTSIRLLDAML
jgi:hypothetical protein